VTRSDDSTLVWLLRSGFVHAYVRCAMHFGVSALR